MRESNEKKQESEIYKMNNYRGKKDIRVYNECPFQVNLVGQRREYIFPPCMDGEPTMNFVDFDEIEYAHSRWNSFKIGLLTFNEEDREEMYEALGIKNWKETVWFDKDIKDIILNPTLEKMQRVIDIKEMVTLERVRGMMVRFVNEKRDVSQNVINVINARFKELNSGNISSKIVIRQSDVERSPSISSEEVDELKRQLKEMKQLMSQIVGKNAAVPQEDETVTQNTAPAKKSTRRTSVKK